MTPERPNIVLVVFDTARADAFGASTPAVWQLGRDGVAFTNAFAPSCWTVPSHASMFLGAPPRSVGLSRAPQGRGRLCAPVIEAQRDRYLPEVLRRAGYRTAAISANLWISRANGFALGFDAFADVSGERVSSMASSGVRSKLRWYIDALRARVDDGARQIEMQLDQWMRTTPHAPFFWFVNLIECHSPYLPPKPYNDLGPLERLRAASDARDHSTLEGVLRAVATETNPPASSLARMRHLYDRSIALMDDWLARTREALDRHGLAGDTTLIVTSDHGENFGEESGLIGHSGSLDDRLLRVPLVIGGPRTPSDRGVVSLSDLPRIIATVAGLTSHPWGEATSNVAIAQYDGPVHADRRSILDDWHATPSGIRRLTERFTGATDGTHKLVRSASGDEGDDLPHLRAALDRADAEAWDPPPQMLDEDAKDAAAIEERMRLLGYL